MGAWDTGLYDNDDAADLRDAFKEVAKLPIDTDELVERLATRFGIGKNPFDEDEVDLWLALADQLHRHGIDHAPTMAQARTIISDGHDLEAKRVLEMSEADLRRRSKVLDKLLETWSAPHPKPKRVKKIPGPEKFLFEVGDVWAYPSMDGAAHPFSAYNFDPKAEPSLFQPDGWGAMVVLDRWHQDGFYARYLIALAMPEGTERPALETVLRAPLQVMEEPEFYIDEQTDELRHRPRHNMMIFTAHIRTPSRVIKGWRAERIGTVSVEPDAARAIAAPGVLAASFLAPGGLASMEHLLSLSSFANHNDFEPEDQRVRMFRSPDYALSDIAAIAA
ncbi:MAG: hypothetical protein AAGA71_14960 [Pseudomonadota bacterium]